MTDTLRGPLLTAQREISVLNMKRSAVLKRVADTTEKEKGAYVSATNMAETLQNTAIRAGYAGSHAKLKTDLTALEVQIRDFKQLFGLEMYQILVDLEDTVGWLPTVRDIRSMYDQARRDVEKIEVRRKEKEKELIKLGGVPMTQSSETSQTDARHRDDEDSTPAYFKEAAAKDAEAAGTSAAYVAPGPAAPQYGSSSSFQQPYNNSQPSYGSTAASSQPPQHSYSDPFGSSMTPQHQQQQHQPVDIFSSFGSASQPAHNDFFGSSSTPAPSTGTIGSSVLPNAGSTSAMTGDPFAVMMDGSSSSHHDAFGTPMGTGNFLQAAASAPPPSDDPFAAFDSLAAPGHQQQQQQQLQGNPMFQY